MEQNSPSPGVTGLHCKCPACGVGPLFQYFLKVRDRCGSCGTDLSGQDSGDGPVPFVIFLVGAIVVGLALLTELHYEPPVWLHLLLWLPLTVALVLILMRPAKALMIAFQYHHRPQDFTSDD
ncbi:MAG: DUF983 domain-containing protein [Geminicoccaceae bacterium]